MRIIFSGLIVILFLLSNSANSSEFPDKISIYFTSSNYFSLLDKINNDNSAIINEKYKKYIKK